MLTVAVHRDAGSRRSSHIAEAMADGIRRCGDAAIIVNGFRDSPGADVCVAYGWAAPELFMKYRAAGRSFVYIDLGWWDRKPHRDLLDGFHKVMVNTREPSATRPYLRGDLPDARWLAARMEVQPWRTGGDYVLIAGMSAKCAHTYGLGPEEWERQAITAIGNIRWDKGRPPVPKIVYRPKPSWPAWTILPGAMISPPDEALAFALDAARAVVSHHSNVAVDALIAGVPVWVEHGVCYEASTPLARLWSPEHPVREPMLADLAWMQYRPSEMRSGMCWATLKETTDLCAE